MSGEVYARMARVIAALSYIPKGRSSGVSYEFRGIDAVMNHLHGPLAEQGLFLAPRVLDDWQVNMIPGTNNRVQGQALFRVCVDVYAEDGSHVTLGPGLAQSHDYGDKAVYQAQQNAIKYLLLEAFCIPTAEQDMDGRESDAVPDPTAAEHARLLSELGALIPSLPEDKREQMREYASRSLANARAGLARTKELIANRPADQPAPETAPFDTVSDEVLSDLLYELGQLKPSDRKKEEARLLGDAQVESLDELPDKVARDTQQRLTKKRAEREAEEAAKEPTQGALA